MTTPSNQDSQASKQKRCEVVNDAKLHQPMTPPTGHINQRCDARLLQQLSLKTKAIALAIVMGTPPLLAIGATAYNSPNQPISEEITPNQQTRASVPADKVPHSIREWQRDIQTVAKDLIQINPQVLEFSNFKEKPAVLNSYSIEAEKSDDKIIGKIDLSEHLLTYLLGKTPNGFPHPGREVALAVNTTASAPKGESLLTLVIRIGLIALLVGAIAAFLAKWAISPILNATNKIGKLGQGEFDSRIDVTGEDELAVLGYKISSIADKLQVLVREQAEQSRRQEAEAKQARMLTDLTLRIRRSLNFQEILLTAVEEVQSALCADRVVICRFDADGEGTIVAESIAPGWTPALNEKINDSAFGEWDVKQYKNGLVRAINNIYQADLTDWQIKIWERFEVKANLVAPIMKDQQKFGLLIAHQCTAPRAWQQSEIDLFMQLAIQVGFALDQANLLQQVEKARQAEEVISSQQRQQKEALQKSLLKLLADVEEAARGNLTVHADVSEGEIGTVADFFNAIVENLRRIVLGVKTAATQVNVDLGEKEEALRQLAEQAFQQSQEITRTLDSVEQMTHSIQAVADNAREAAAVARTASTTASSGGAAIALTFQSIFSLRDTVAETAKKVKRLGEASQQISQVVSLINRIALQTNVLAVNASIEAARAGKEGQGFAVVAEEIGQLAAQASAATKQVQQIVENIQSETNEVVRAMEQGTTQVVEGTYLATDAKLSLEQIVEVSRQIDNLVQSISSETVSQAQTAQAVANLMKEIAEVSSQTSDSSRQVSSSLQQTVEVARQLQASVGVFKLGMHN